MRYLIEKSSVTSDQRQELPDAIYLALELIDSGGSGVVTVTDTETGTIMNAEKIHEVAKDLPSWSVELTPKSPTDKSA